MAKEQGSLESGYYEMELVEILEDAVRREVGARDFYLTSAQNPHNKPETKAMFEMLAREEERHAVIIRGRLEENQMRVKAITFKGPYGIPESHSSTSGPEPRP